MEIGKTILIIAVLLAIFWYVAPIEFDKGREAVVSFLSNEKTKDAIKSGTDSIKDRFTNNDNVTDVVADVAAEATDYIDDNEEITEPNPLIGTDPCGWPNYQEPYFGGTVYEGDDCVTSGKNQETVCLLYQP